MRALLVEAEQRRLSTLFALTRVVGFFLRCGFVPAERDRFPQKIWRDCWQCPFLERCDETAVVLEIGQ
jgi:amino-acid N-acetyltransferase